MVNGGHLDSPQLDFKLRYDQVIIKGTPPLIIFAYKKMVDIYIHIYAPNL